MPRQHDKQHQDPTPEEIEKAKNKLLQENKSELEVKMLPHEEMAELLDPEKSKLARFLNKTVNAIHFINGTSKENHVKVPFKEKLRRFLGEGIEEEKDLAEPLKNFHEEMESEESEITLEENNKLEEINNKLLGKKDAIATVINKLITVQDLALKNAGINETQRSAEHSHIVDVTITSQLLFKELPMLHLIAVVHDFVKHNAGYTDLGLHEIASAYVGPVALEEVIRQHTDDLDLNEEEIALIVKLATRAIYTHGDQEWPQNNSKPTNFHEHIRNLFGGLYIFTKKRSVIDQTNPDGTPTFTAKIVAATNFADAITGTNYLSFIKYNSFNGNDRVLKNKSLATYITEDLLSSFDSNMGMNSSVLLAKTDNPALRKEKGYNTAIKNLIVAFVNNKTSDYENLWEKDDILKLESHLINLKLLRKRLETSVKKENKIKKRLMFLKDKRLAPKLIIKRLDAIHKVTDVNVKNIRSDFDKQIKEFLTLINDATKKRIT